LRFASCSANFHAQNGEHGVRCVEWNEKRV
jgi:hypothetical protein